MRYSSLALATILSCTQLFHVESKHHLRGLRNGEDLKKEIQDLKDLMGKAEQKMVILEHEEASIEAAELKIEEVKAAEKKIEEAKAAEKKIEEAKAAEKKIKEAKAAAELEIEEVKAAEKKIKEEKEAAAVVNFLATEDVLSELKLEMNEVKNDLRDEPFLTTSEKNNLIAKSNQIEAEIVNAEEKEYHSDESSLSKEKEAALISDFEETESLLYSMNSEIEMTPEKAPVEDVEEAALISSFVEAESMLANMKEQIDEMEMTFQKEPFRDDTEKKEMIANLKYAVNNAEAAVIQAEEDTFETEKEREDEKAEAALIDSFVEAESEVEIMKEEIKEIEGALQAEPIKDAKKEEVVNKLKKAVGLAENEILNAEEKAFEDIDDGDYDDESQYNEAASIYDDDGDYDDESQYNEAALISDFASAEHDVADLKDQLAAIESLTAEDPSLRESKAALVSELKETIESADAALLQLEIEAFGIDDSRDSGLEGSEDFEDEESE